MIYLASPYTHPNGSIREMRFQSACCAAWELIRSGRILYAPVVHCHPIAQYGLPRDWSYWERANRVLLNACDEVVVLTLDGWEKSEGVQAEIQIATELHTPVRYIESIVNVPKHRQTSQTWI